MDNHTTEIQLHNCLVAEFARIQGVTYVITFRRGFCGASYWEAVLRAGNSCVTAISSVLEIVETLA
jgi:hypothetical protein